MPLHFGDGFIGTMALLEYLIANTSTYVINLNVCVQRHKHCNTFDYIWYIVLVDY
jgi:hypothetical protein